MKRATAWERFSQAQLGSHLEPFLNSPSSGEHSDRVAISQGILIEAGTGAYPVRNVVVARNCFELADRLAVRHD